MKGDILLRSRSSRSRSRNIHFTFWDAFPIGVNLIEEDEISSYWISRVYSGHTLYIT